METNEFLEEPNMIREAAYSIHGIKDSISVPNNIDSLVQAFKKNLPQINEINEIINKSIPEKIKKVLTVFDELSKTIGRVYEKYSNIFDNISIPFFDEEWIREKRISYEKWGEYGWTAIDWASIVFFETIPATKKEVNAKALLYCDNKHMEGLFSNLLETKGIKKKDLSEAIDDYRSKRYKSCACILFSLIDGILIRSMKKGERRRPSGENAAKKLNERITNAEETKNMVFNLLTWAGVFTALISFFQPGDDFKQQPQILGRNWLDHGMLHRPVKKMDCIQLFLLLNNLISMKELLRRIS